MKFIMRIISYMIAIILILTLTPLTPMVDAAEGNIIVEITGQFKQSEARTMLGMINSFRTAEVDLEDPDPATPWAWDNSDAERIPYQGLGELTYDYDLEQIAMQRAVEIAVAYGHGRPNGTLCDDYTYNGTSLSGENIAAGYNKYSTVEQAFLGWREDDKPYSGQGHRRNMLNQAFNAVGIAGFSVGNHYFWVQEFGFQPSGAGAAEALDAQTTRDVEVDPSYVTEATAGEPKSVTVEVGGSSNLPAADIRLKISGSTPDNYSFATWPEDRRVAVAVRSEYLNWVSSNESIAKIENGKLIGVAAGETTLTASIFGKTVMANVTVDGSAFLKNIADAVITSDWPDNTAVYSYLTEVPQITVIYDGKTLTKGVDYAISWSDITIANNVYADCVDPCQFTATVTGRGDYAGSQEVVFNWLKVQTSDFKFCEFDGNNNPLDSIEGVYEVSIPWLGTHRIGLLTNSAYPEYVTTSFSSDAVSGSFNTRGVDEENEREWIYGDFTADHYSADLVEVTVASNDQDIFEGPAVTAYIHVLPINLSGSVVTLDQTDFAYNGEEHKPAVTVTYNGKVIDSSLYQVTYENNIGSADEKTYAKAIVDLIPDFAELLPDGTELSTDFTISPKKFEIAGLSSEGYEYTGDEIRPEVTVTAGGIELPKDAYTLTYENNINAGAMTASVTVSSNSEQYDEIEPVTALFTITPADISTGEISSSWKNNKAPYDFDMNIYNKPVISVVWHDKKLVAGTDYTVPNMNFSRVGYYPVTIRGIGNFTGTNIIVLQVVPGRLNLRFRTDGGEGSVSLDDEGMPFVELEKGGTTTVWLTDYNLISGSNSHKLTMQPANTLTATFDNHQIPSFIDEETGKRIYCGVLVFSEKDTAAGTSPCEVLVTVTVTDSRYEDESVTFKVCVVDHDLNNNGSLTIINKEAEGFEPASAILAADGKTLELTMPDKTYTEAFPGKASEVNEHVIPLTDGMFTFSTEVFDEETGKANLAFHVPNVFWRNIRTTIDLTAMTITFVENDANYDGVIAAMDSAEACIADEESYTEESMSALKAALAAVTFGATADEQGRVDAMAAAINAAIAGLQHKQTPSTEHTWDEGKVTTEPTCTTAGVKTFICTTCGETKTEKIDALGHDFSSEWTIDKEATATEAGSKSHHCKRCDEKSDITEIPATGLIGIERIAGSDRFATSRAIADKLKEVLGVEKFNAAVISVGANFPDALAGGYLASTIDAPILMISKGSKDAVEAYVKANVNPGSRIYVLGGSNVLADDWIRGLSGYDVKRLFGPDRYQTDIAILKEVGVKAGDDILVATGKNYADALSASAVPLPILLVGASLTEEQTAYLGSLNGSRFHIIGSTSAVPAGIESALKTYGSVDRIAGANRFETSVAIAERFCPSPNAVTLAWGKNFPDGLCGGVLANKMNAPLLLVTNSEASYKAAIAYCEAKGVKGGKIFGGDNLITDQTAQQIIK